VLEQRIALDREFSVVLARGQQGQVTAFPVAENVHINGILHSTVVPATISSDQSATAIKMATQIAQGLDYVGTLAVEFFLSKQGSIIVNEIAPRPHNSGHYTLDACRTSQFEQQVRMLCGLTAGDCRLTSPVVMINLLGDVWGNSQPNWATLLQTPAAKLHLYGKKDARQGRKMGHFNLLGENPADLLREANALFEQLKAE